MAGRFQSDAFGIITGRNCSLEIVHCGSSSDRVGIHAERNLYSTVTVDVFRVKSDVNFSSLFNLTTVPVRVSINELNLVQKQVKLEFRLKCFNLAMVDFKFWFSFRARRQKKLRINIG